jgi:hypothetical protein
MPNDSRVETTCREKVESRSKIFTPMMSPKNNNRKIVRRERLGGLLNYYHRGAA